MQRMNLAEGHRLKSDCVDPVIGCESVSVHVSDNIFIWLRSAE